LSWSWSYGSWIYNCLCERSLLITTNVVNSNPAHGEMYSIQHYVAKFVSNSRSRVFVWVLRFPPPIKWPPRYSWNIVESGIKDHKPIRLFVCPRWNMVPIHSVQRTTVSLQEIKSIAEMKMCKYFFIKISNFSQKSIISAHSYFNILSLYVILKKISTWKMKVVE
jgi:hypothetical protein